MSQQVLEDLRRNLRALQESRELSQAGAALARMRVGYRRNRKPKKWTGHLADGSRAWVGRKLIMPDGKVGIVCAIIRGEAAIRWEDPFHVDGTRFGLFRVEELKTYRHPAAVHLGRAKGGKKERPSLRKAITARINGAMPVRSSSRARGRPRRS